MAIRVTVSTGDCPAIVLAYPRDEDGDPVAGEALTDMAQLPPHFEQAFTVKAGFDLLVAEMPAPAEAEAVPQSEAAVSDWPIASLREAC